MPEKPSRNEEEYFAREEAERAKKTRAAADQDRVAAERQSHFMKCPKCGADLKPDDLHGIQVDRCPECHGIWFDQGETEQMLDRHDTGGVGKIFQSIFRGVKTKPASGE